MTMILDLPEDLVMEIFHRVPLKSMRGVRLTCKTLNRLSKSESFAKMHLAKEIASRKEGEHQRVVILDDTLSLMSVVVDGEPKVKLSALNQQVKISQVFHCEGLLLCVLKDDDRRIVVWNPYWGQTRWIEPRHTRPLSLLYSNVYSVGYANKRNTCRRTHKLLRYNRVWGGLGERFQWYDIYDFDSDQWTTLDDFQGWHISSYQRGVSLKGNTYFCATKVTLEEDHRGEEEDVVHLICFDYQRESFGPLMRLPFRSTVFDYVTLSSVREEKLAVLLTHNESNPYELDVWITTKIEPGEVSWSKFLTLYTEPYYPMDFGGFFIDEGKKVAMGFDKDDHRDRYIKLSFIGEAGYFKSLQLVEKSYASTSTGRSRQVCSYVPSLVKLKQPARGPSKQHRDSEQRRYDEKMSRLVEIQRPFEYTGAVKRQKT